MGTKSRTAVAVLLFIFFKVLTKLKISDIIYADSVRLLTLGVPATHEKSAGCDRSFRHS